VHYSEGGEAPDVDGNHSDLDLSIVPFLFSDTNPPYSPIELTLLTYNLSARNTL